MTKFVPKEVIGDSTFVSVYDPESGDTGYTRLGDLVNKSETTVTAVTSPGGGVGNLVYDDYASYIAFDKQTTPRNGPQIVPENQLTTGKQVIARRSSTVLDIISRAGVDLWLRTIKTGVFTATGSAGVKSEFWRLTGLTKLRGCIAVPDVTPSSAGSFATESAIMMPAGANGGISVASGVIYKATATNAAISWAVTVPPSGVVRAAVYASSSATVQTYSVTCGDVTVTGSVAPATLGVCIAPTVVTLYGCTPGASTLTVVKNGTGGSFYTSGPCFDLSAGESPPAGSTLIYWSELEDKYIDHNGANDLAFKIGGTFYGSYHGGHGGVDTFVLDGVVTDVLAGAAFYEASKIDVLHSGGFGGLGMESKTTFYAGGHVFDADVTCNGVVLDEGNYLMSCCKPALNVVNGKVFPNDSATYTQDVARPYIDQANDGRTLALTAHLERFDVNGVNASDTLVSRVVNSPAASYIKGYVSTVSALLVNSISWRAVWNY